MHKQGGNFHLKVGGPKAVAMLVTLCWGLQSVVDIITQTTTTRWEVVKNSASPKRPFFSRISHLEHFQSKS